MNRLSPLIARMPDRSGPARYTAIGTLAETVTASNEDLRLFFTAFAGGLIFFGTLFS
jgi:hypothetical protein